MIDREIYTKTDAGREEIRTRVLHLPSALRNALLLVDGNRTAGQLKELLSGGKAPADALQQLLAQGLIRLRETDSLSAQHSTSLTSPAVPAISAQTSDIAKSAKSTKPGSTVGAAAPKQREQSDSVPTQADESSAPSNKSNAPVEPVASPLTPTPDLHVTSLGAAPKISELQQAPAGSASVPDGPVVAQQALAPSPQNIASERYERLYNLMNEIVRDYLGLRGYFMQLKIEKCQSADELLGLQEELGNSLAKSHGKDIAAELVGRIRAAA